MHAPKPLNLCVSQVKEFRAAAMNIPIVPTNCLPSCRGKAAEWQTDTGNGCRPLFLARLLAGSDNVAVIEVAMFKALGQRALKTY